MHQPIKRDWYEIKAEGPAGDGQRSAEIYIYGNIGDRWDEQSVTAASFVRDLQMVAAEKLVVRINSYGGSVPDGLAIYNALQRHPATIDVKVDGVAISCASYVAMAADHLEMAENAMMMIHAPWGAAIGNAASLRDQADMLDKYAEAMSGSYAKKCKKPQAEILGLLTDGKDHWYTASEAQAAGFADAVGPAVSVAACGDFSRFSPPAAAAAFNLPKEIVMPDITPAATPQPAAPVAAAPATPFARTKEMNTEVLAMFKPFAERDGVTALQTEILADPAVTIEQAQARLLAKLGEKSDPATPVAAFPKIETLVDERDQFRAAASSAIVVRAGLDPESAKTIRANPYRGARLLDLARASLQRIGVKTDGMSQMEVVAAAFTQSTSDFPILLENAMHKSLQAAYAVAALTWRRFCHVGSVSDFRAHPRYRVGSLSNLDSINELGEFKNKTIPDGEKSSITAGTKGNIINLSRQAVINDDLGAFVGLSASLGRAAARTIESDVYALLALNSGMGPTMSDTYSLFHANHSNVGSGAAISMAALDADRVVLASQKDVGGNDYLSLSPAVLLVPMTLGGTARGIVGAEYDPDTTGKLQKPNIVKNMVGDVVDTPRLTGTRRYLFADPNEAPVLEVAFLDGTQDPYLELQNGFEVDGAAYKVRLDYGVGAIDYRGAVTNAGV